MKSSASARMGKITTQVVGRTADFLTGQRVKDGVLVKSNGEPLTIGEVKAQINCGWQNWARKTPKARFLPSGMMRACRIPAATQRMCCAWARRSSMISSRVNRAADIFTISPAPGAWVMRRMKP